MGCGLRKLRQSEDRQDSPGKIYSTLKRPQVETKVGVAYTYRHLDFLVGKDDGTSTLQLSSVRELPAQVLELYQQGFELAAVHPFVHPCGPEPARLQRQLYRAVLVRIADSVEKSQSELVESCSLRLEECLSAERSPSTEHIQGYVKKIQDAADQGIMFVGFIQEPGRVRVHLSALGDPEEPFLSLHSSPSSLHSSGVGQSPSPLELTVSEEQGKSGGDVPTSLNGEDDQPAGDGSRGADLGGDVVVEEESSVPASPSSRGSDLESPTHNNNETKVSQRTNKLPISAPVKNGMELFALYNHPCSRDAQVKYYTVKVPLRVQPHEEGIPNVEANWLDHMTQHFNNGASLVDGYFQLGDVGNDSLPKLVESVFIFQEGLEGDSNTATAYDAIVVEQWTIIDGVQVKTDYIPLLQSLAMYGWRLTCVLPTPIVKTNSDGSLSTKQIVFLQRPVLPRKKRESKKLIFKTRNKSNKNSIKDMPKGKKKKNTPTTTAERELDDQRISDGTEKVAKDEERKGASEEKGEEEEEKEVELEDKIKPARAEPQTREAGDEGVINTVEEEIEQVTEIEEEKGGEVKKKEEAEEGEEDGEKEDDERNDSRASTEPEMNGETDREETDRKQTDREETDRKETECEDTGEGADEGGQE
ncbi:raftlin-like isoform X2 [Clupea harengus]|uniref:Raftlin-like isoform X2 n=1 Tax=Clupea harengus TaxID=7950 RepID=A0A6P8G8K0_CLUHA|nr:raftlin-like isoform X2 [Clupea harengus]